MTLSQTLHELVLALRRDEGEKILPLGMAARAFALYRELLFNNLEAGLAACFPQLRRLLARRWENWVAAFLAQGDIPSPAFHECPEAFLRFLLAREEELPPWALALAHWEWEELALSLAPWTPAMPVKPVFESWSDRPVLAPVHGLRHYRFAVHRASLQADPPAAGDFYLFRFRDGQGVVRHRELSLGEARFLAALEDGAKSLGEALSRAFPEISQDENLRIRIQPFLQVLMDDEALLGFHSSGSSR